MAALLAMTVLIAGFLSTTNSVYLPSVTFPPASPSYGEVSFASIERIILRKISYNLSPDTWPSNPPFNWTKHWTDWEPFLAGLKQLAVGDPANTECTRYPVPSYAKDRDSEAELARQQNPSHYLRLMKYLWAFRDVSGVTAIPVGNGTVELAENLGSFCARYTLNNRRDRESYGGKVICMKKPEGGNYPRSCRYVIFPDFPDYKQNTDLVLIGYNYAGPNDCRDTVERIPFYSPNILLVINSDFRLERVYFVALKAAIFYNSTVAALSRTPGRSAVNSRILYLQLTRSSMVWQDPGCSRWWCGNPKAINGLRINLIKLTAGSEFVIKSSARRTFTNAEITSIVVEGGNVTVLTGETADPNAVFDSNNVTDSESDYREINAPNIDVSEVIIAPARPDGPPDTDGAKPAWKCAQRLMDYMDYFWRRNTDRGYQYSIRQYLWPADNSYFNTHEPCPGESTLEYVELSEEPRCIMPADLTGPYPVRRCRNLEVLGRNKTTGVPVVRKLPLSYPGVRSATKLYRDRNYNLRSECLVQTRLGIGGWRETMPPFFPAEEASRI